MSSASDRLRYLQDWQEVLTDAERQEMWMLSEMVERKEGPKSTTITPFFRYYDLWIGAYWDRKNRTIYICPVPMFGIKIRLKENGK